MNTVEHAAPSPRSSPGGRGRKRNSTAHSLFRLDEVLDAVGLGNDGHAVFADREASSAIEFLVVADFDSGRDVHALIDDGAANFGVPANVDVVEHDRIFNRRVTVDTNVRAENRTAD